MKPGTRKNLIQPEDWWSAFEAAAKKEGKSLAEWIGDTCRAALPDRTAAKLTERGTRGRPKSPVPPTTSEKSRKSV